jgi:5-methylcytosine-specific restriction endonuclease McrA
MPPDVTPHTKDKQLARGERRYRRKIASAQEWQRIADAKRGPCRVCTDPASNGSRFGLIQFHHIVPRSPWAGDDVADNIAPLCPGCHEDVTRRDGWACRALIESLTDAEYAYAVQKSGESFFVRAYGIEYKR